jgi:hypothetical protein
MGTGESMLCLKVVLRKFTGTQVALEVRPLSTFLYSLANASRQQMLSAMERPKANGS